MRAPDHEALTALGIEPPRGDILGVRAADEGVKFALIADEPNLYFTTPHFDGYPAVGQTRGDRRDESARADRRGLLTQPQNAWSRSFSMPPVAPEPVIVGNIYHLSNSSNTSHSN